MDIREYYQQAKQWQMDKETREREDQIRLQSQLAEVWNYAKDEIRKTYPFNNAKLFEAEKGMSGQYPVIGGNYCFDLALPMSGKTRLFAGEPLAKGVIRIVMNYATVNVFKTVRYIVSVDGSEMGFDEPGDAFLACCLESNYSPEPTL